MDGGCRAGVAVKVYALEVAKPSAGFTLLNVYRTEAGALKAAGVAEPQPVEGVPDIVHRAPLGEHEIQVRRVRVLT